MIKSQYRFFPVTNFSPNPRHRIINATRRIRVNDESFRSSWSFIYRYVKKHVTRVGRARMIYYTFRRWYHVSRDEFIGCKNCGGPISPGGEALSRRAPAPVDRYHVERTPTTIISDWPDSKVDAPGSVTSSEHRNTRAIKWKWDRDSLRRQKWRLPERGGESGGRLPRGKGCAERIAEWGRRRRRESDVTGSEGRRPEG